MTSPPPSLQIVDLEGRVVDVPGSLHAKLTAVADSIAERWAADRAHGEFPGAAHDALVRVELHRSVSLDDIIEHATHAQLPRQNYMGTAFGQPAITLIERDGFAIDAYLWLEPETAIHDHGFCGALAMLQGVSLHGRHRFTPQGEGPVVRGTLSRQEVELLQPGAVRRIEAGPGFIHQVLHLSRPTVSLLARTLSSPPHVVYQYFPHVAAQSAGELRDEGIRKRLELLAFLVGAGAPLDDPRIRRILAGLPPLASFWALMRLAELYEDDEGERLRESLAEVATRWDWFEGLVDSLREGTRSRVDWKLVHGDDERLVLGLVQLQCERDLMSELVSQYRPGVDVDELLTRTMATLIDGDAVDFRLDGSAREIVLKFVRGQSDQAIARELESRHGIAAAVVLGDVQRLRQAARASRFLRPFV